MAVHTRGSCADPEAILSYPIPPRQHRDPAGSFDQHHGDAACGGFTCVPAVSLRACQAVND